jgi:hypothetical protein
MLAYMESTSQGYLTPRSESTSFSHPSFGDTSPWVTVGPGSLPARHHGRPHPFASTLSCSVSTGREHAPLSTLVRHRMGLTQLMSLETGRP